MSRTTTRRVFQVATGNVGSEMVGRIRDHPDLELVGLHCYSADKIGRDAGEIVGIGPLGVTATGTVEEIIAAGPDCVNFNGVWPDMDLFVAVLGAGINVVSTADWITAATALINSYCRRPDLNVIQYTERLRLTSGSQTVLLSYLPLAPLGTATTPIVSIEGRYSKPRRGESVVDPLFEIVTAFSLPGQWTAIDPNSVDHDSNIGELTLPWNLLGLTYNEVAVTYTAGLTTIGDDVKTACAQIVRNAQSTPALNASRTKIDTMQMQYFSSSLVDETVQAWLRPYVANRLG